MARAPDAHGEQPADSWPSRSASFGELLTPKDVARRLRVTDEQVRALIRKGELAAINVGTGSKRPLYRITGQALRDFLSRRWQPGRAAPRKHRRSLPVVPDFFPDLQ